MEIYNAKLEPHRPRSSRAAVGVGNQNRYIRPDQRSGYVSKGYRQSPVQDNTQRQQITRDFSKFSQSNVISYTNQNRRASRSRYAGLAQIPWSKGAAHRKDAIKSETPDALRKPTRPLSEMEGSPELVSKNERKSKKSRSKDHGAEVDEAATWKAFVERDEYMDQVKRFNTSNIKLLKDKEKRERGIRCPSEYDCQIRRCLANRGAFPATWGLLNLLFSTKMLDDYIIEREYSEYEMKSSKLNELSMGCLNDGRKNSTTSGEEEEDDSDQKESGSTATHVEKSDD